MQSTPIPAAITSEPLPTDYWTRPIYGENTNWYAISSNWLGVGSGGYTGLLTAFGGNGIGPDEALFHADATGPLTSHVMWTLPIQSGGVVGGNAFFAGGSYSGAAIGVGYYEGTAYQQRFINPIIMDGILYFTEPVGFTGPGSGPTEAVNLQTGQVLWSSTHIPPLSFGYIYNLWNPDEHGTFPPILVASNSITGQYEFFDAQTGDALFNATGVPASTSFVTAISSTVYSFANQVASNTVAGPSGEQLKLVISNDGTAANPQWYLSEWNSSKLWQYDINPYTGGGSLSPDIINATNGLLIPTLPVPLNGETGTLPTGLSSAPGSVPYGSVLTVAANVPINGVNGVLNSITNPSLATYDWNVSLPWLDTMPPAAPDVNPVTGQLAQPPAGANPVSIMAVNYGDEMLCMNGTLPVGFAAAELPLQLPYTYFTVNLNASKGALGSVLWMKTYNPPAGNLTVVPGPVDFNTGVFVLNYRESLNYVGYSLKTGDLLWGPTQTQNAWDYYGGPNQGYLSSQEAYGNIYSTGYAGIVYCYNDSTGALEWTYGNGPPGSDNSTNGGLNIFYGDYPIFVDAIGNGVVYLTTTEHTVPDPIYKGALARAINATTGQEIWTLSDYTSEFVSMSYAIADGYATFFNGYDGQIYSVGQGSSATTVQAPLTAITAGTNVAIQGTVMDTSAGTQQTEQKADFPSGVPCASDAIMTQWMGYVYQQQPEPTNFTGVTVTLTAIDPNSNFVTLGTTTTNSKGLFNYMWQTPSIPGKYTVTATFAGNNGYWGSSAQTTMIVQNAPSATAAPTPAPASNTNTYVLGIGIAIIVIIIIGFAILFLALRKKP